MRAALCGSCPVGPLGMLLHNHIIAALTGLQQSPHQWTLLRTLILALTVISTTNSLSYSDAGS